jgi:hypothetical protein
MQLPAFLLLSLACVATGQLLSHRELIEPLNHAAIPTVTYCNTSNSIFKLDSVTWIPYAVQPGANFTLVASGHFTQRVTAGDLVINAKMDGIPVNKKLDLCEEAKKANHPCPLEGQFKVDHSWEVPSIVFGKITTTATAFANPGNAEIFCIEIAINFGPL